MNTLREFVEYKLTHCDKTAEANGYPLKMENCKKNKKMRDLKVYGNTVQSNLPLEYQQVEYIEQVGKYHININYIPTVNTRIVYEVLNANASYGFETGTRVAYQDNQFVSCVYSSTSGKSRFYYADNEYEDIEVDTSQKHTYEMNGNGTYYIDGELKATKTGSFTVERSILIWNFNNGSSANSINAAGRLYSYKVYENGELQRDLIPCYRRKDRSVGLYDLVNGTFYKCNIDHGNYNYTYTMLKGSDCNATPTPEAPVEVQSVGELTYNLLNDTTFRNSDTITGLKCDYEGDGVFHIYGEHNPSKASGELYSSVVSIDIPIDDVDSYYSVRGEVIDGTSGNLNTYFFLSVKNETTTVNFDYAAIPPNSKVGYSHRGFRKPSSRLENATSFSRAWLYFIFNSSNEPEYLDYRIRVWVYKGEDNKPYEPYGKYKIPVVVKGKNLADVRKAFKNFSDYTELEEDGRQCIRVKSNGGAYAFFDFTFKENTQYTISFEFKCKYDRSGVNLPHDCPFAVYYTNGDIDYCSLNPIDGTWHKRTLTTNANKTVSHIKQFSFDYRVYDYIDVNTFQLEEGTVTEYEPYIEPITTNIFLNEPLRKVGNYADYIDFKENKVVRKCIKKYLENYTWNTHTNYGDMYSFWTEDRSIVPDYINNLPKCNYGLSNVFPVYATSDMTAYTCAIIMYTWASNVRVIIPAEYLSENSVSTLKSWLKENDVYMIRIRKTPTEEPLNIDLPKLTAKTTIIEVDTSLAPSNAYGKYIKR